MVRNTTSDVDVLVDGGAIVVGSIAIVAASQQLPVMTVAIPLLFVIRTLLWWWAWRRSYRESPRLLPEVGFLALCTVLGGFNDWNSVVAHGIYDYSVPCYFPDLSTIPIWMLLFWGLILRFFTTFALWQRLGAPERPRGTIRVGLHMRELPWLRLLFLLILVVGTRQAIYRLYLDPWWSWLPFAAAGCLYVVFCGIDRHELRLLAVTLVVGPLVEVMYIQVADLHHYHLGWLGGVPLWIALWWCLAILIWKEIGGRIYRYLTTA